MRTGPKAEELVWIEHQLGRGWRAFRRGWASARRQLPKIDVAAAGEWEDTATMKRCYQHADAKGVYRVVSEGSQLAVGQPVPRNIKPLQTSEALVA